VFHQLPFLFVEPDSPQHSRTEGRSPGQWIWSVWFWRTWHAATTSINQNSLGVAVEQCLKKVLDRMAALGQKLFAHETQETLGGVESLTWTQKCGLDIFGRCQWKRGGVLGIWQTIGKLNDGEHRSEATETDSIGHKGIHGEKLWEVMKPLRLVFYNTNIRYTFYNITN